MSVQRTSSKLLFIGVLGAIGGVYLLGQLMLHRSDGRVANPQEVAEILAEKPPHGSAETPTQPSLSESETQTATEPKTQDAELATRLRSTPTLDEPSQPAAKRRWEISGQVFVPPTSPVDATLHLVARPTAPATLFEPWNPPDWNDRGEGDQAVAQVASDGSFRLILPVHWERAFIDLSGRYLYFDQPLEVIQEARTDGAPLFLRPRLGAWVRGRLHGLNGEQLAENFIRRTRVSAVPDLDALRDALAQGGLSRLITERLSSRPNDEGVFELRGMPALTSFLVAPVAEGLLPGKATLLHAQPGAELDVDFDMAPGKTIRGTVTDTEGRPLSGARVSYHGDLELDGFAPLFGPWAVIDGSDESGLFELHGLPARAELALDCELEGWILSTPLVVDTTGPASAPATESSSPPAELVEAILQRGHILEGRVAWADGSPAPGFQVRLERRSREVLALTTDAEGRFRATGLSAHPFTLIASGVESLDPARNRVGWQRLASVDPTTSGLQVTLGQGAPLDGTVRTIGGERVHDYELLVMPLDVEGSPDGFRASFTSLPGTPVTEKTAGRFRLEGLAQGAWSISVLAPGYVTSKPRIVRLPRTATAEQLSLELMATGSATGAILDPEGHRVAGARLRNLVSWEDADGQQHMGSVMSSDEWRSDAYGRFRIGDLKPGTHRWIASAPGFANSRMVEVLVPAGGHLDEIQIMLRRGGLLTGTLLDERNQPVAGRFISVARADFLDARTGRTDTEGSFAFKELEPGKWRVYALPNSKDGKGAGYDAPLEQLALSSEVVIHDGDESHVILGGRPAPEILVGHLHGSVEDAQGRAQEGVLVSLGKSGPLSTRAPYGNRLLQAETNTEGHFLFEALALGTYDLCASPPTSTGLATGVVQRITLSETTDEIEEVAVRLQPGGALGGRVVDGEGKAIPGASIFVREADGVVLARISELTSDAEGRFRYAALLPGRYTVLARTTDGSTEESEALLVSAGSETTTEIVLVPGTLLSVQLRSREGAAQPARVLVLDEQGRRVNGLVGMETFLREIESGVTNHEQTVGPLAPGLYRVSATLEDGRKVEEAVRLSGAPLERVILHVE